MVVGDSRNVSGIIHGGDMDVKAAAGRTGKSEAVRCGRNASVRGGIRVVVHHDGVAFHSGF